MTKMAQVNSLQNVATTLNTGVSFVSLNDMIMSLSRENKPMTLRQVASRGFYDIDTVSTALHERTRSGDLASFKIGPLNYYASPQTALMSEGPNLSSLTNEVVKNALWLGKRRVSAITEMVFDFTGR